LTARASKILKQLGTPCLIHQAKYNMFDRWVEEGLLAVLKKEGIGCIAFSPLAQGLLTDRYMHGIPVDSRAAKPHGFLKAEQVTVEKINIVQQLSTVARQRNQSMAQMALSWVLRHKEMTSVLIGASRVAQIDDAVGALANLQFSSEELKTIDTILSGKKENMKV
jgi:L-glyceraldehyde 3-phosphate reductase